jgi:hypothetical protein
MRKMVILGFAAALAISACAGAEDVDSVSPSGEDGTAPVEEADLPVDSTVPVEGETPTESIPEDPNADLSSDAVTSGLAEPGDTPPPADDSDSVVLGEGLPPAVESAMADLAAYLGVSIDVIDWVSQKEVDWPDGSLGCPQPDMSYTQAIVNGSLIVFEVDGVSYEYHSGGSREPFLCLPAATSKDVSSKDGSGSGGYVLPTTTVDMSG